MISHFSMKNRKVYVWIKAENLPRKRKMQILKKVKALGWDEVLGFDIHEDIHTINRRVSMFEYIDGQQNMKFHDWTELHELGLSVEYAGSNGL